MDSNPFVKNFEELLSNISRDVKDTSEINSLYIASDEDESIFKELLVQPMKRIIGDKEIIFLAIRNMKLKEEFKGKHLFSDFIEKLEKLNVPIFMHDIINKKFFNYFQNNGYEIHKENKYDHELISCFKLPKTIKNRCRIKD